MRPLWAEGVELVRESDRAAPVGAQAIRSKR